METKKAYRIKTYMWMVIILMYCILALVGCGSFRAPSPAETANVPVDCLNRQAIVTYLNQQISYVSGKGEGDAQLSALKYKIWQVRAVCQSM
jgi:Tfp pilus assembly protein PilN